MEEWKADNYNETSRNCYSFVMHFLRLLGIKQLKKSLLDKTQFCQDYILPKTKMAAKYITLYRWVKKDQVAIIQCSPAIN